MWRLILLVASLLCAEKVETFYGMIEVDEPVLLDLIHSPALQRLKEIHQYGVSYYTTHREEYNRYDHSIGVFAILRKEGACIEEQIAGLLHDVSHTVFSHVGDWLFGKEHQEDDYQSLIFKDYLVRSGVEAILLKHGFHVDEVLHKDPRFMMLEQKLPNLCADRIDYNIQGAFYQGFLTREQAIQVFQDLHFEEGKWVGKEIDLLKQLTRFSLFMTETCWGSDCNYVLSRWLADAMLRAVEIGSLDWDDIHYGIDREVWSILKSSKDPFILDRMDRLAAPRHFYKRVDAENADVIVRFRCRGIDPWVAQEGAVVRLCAIDAILQSESEKLKKMAATGWPISLTE